MATEYALTPFEHIVHHFHDGTVTAFNDQSVSDENIAYQAWLAAPNVPDPYVPAPPMTLDARQFWTQLAVVGKISETAALNAMAHDFPDVIETFILTLPASEQFMARMRFKATSFTRSQMDHTKAVFAFNDAAMDQFFTDAALL
jgi:hypothetical protein